MNTGVQLVFIKSEATTDPNVYESIYLNVVSPEQNIEPDSIATGGCLSLSREDMEGSFTHENVANDTNATEDESMAAEALSQLSNSKVEADGFQNHAAICIPEQSNDQVASHVTNMPYSCGICNESFVNKKDLTRHDLQSHWFQKSYPCKVCGNVFQKASSLSNHLKIHKFQAGILDSDLLNHQNNNESTLSESNAGIWNDASVSQADNSNQEDSLLVKEEMTVVDFEEIDKNIKSENTDLIEFQTEKSIICDPEVKKVHTCKFCDKIFVSEKEFFSHYKLHSNLLQQSDESPSDDELLLTHNLECNEGSSKISSKSKPKCKLQKYPCSHCEKKFTTKQKLQTHMWIHRRYLFCCEICGLSFEAKMELDVHRLSTHFKDFAHVCQECGKSFSSRQGLWEHNRIHESTSQSYKCDECTKTFMSRQGLQIHKRVHSGEKPYACQFCWKRFRDGGTLRKHERIHTGVRPHICPLCSRAFNQKVVLREHIRGRHTANQEPGKGGLFGCHLCNKKFSDKDDLSSHVVRHSDELALQEKKTSKLNPGSSKADVFGGNTNSEAISKGEMMVTGIIKPVNHIDINCGNIRYIHLCGLCGDQFDNEDDLTRHVQIHI